MNNKTFSVTVDYDPDQKIGEMTLDLDRLPKGLDYCFAIGGKVLDGGLEWSEELQRSVYVIRDFELIEITLRSDQDYYDYLTHGEGAGQLARAREKAKEDHEAA